MLLVEDACQQCLYLPFRPVVQRRRRFVQQQYLRSVRQRYALRLAANRRSSKLFAFSTFPSFRHCARRAG